MKKWACLICTGLVLLSLNSCIFQSDPVAPNNPPTIESYHPKETYFSVVVLDSCLFSIQAIDPDKDQIDYKFLVGDSVLSTVDTFVFRTVESGYFNIQGRAYDGEDYVYHEWHVTVLDEQNEPPKINWYVPEQEAVATTVGDTLEFYFTADDDDPETLQYIYKLDNSVVSISSPHYVARFLERGDYLLKGIVWDGEYGDTISWSILVTGDPDTIPPSPINDLEGDVGEEMGSIWLSWTAPGDDSTYGRVSAYIVRTSKYPILTEHDWDEAAGKLGEPVPGPAGTRESMIVTRLNPGTYIYVTMRALDDFFNLSPIGNCIRLLVRGVDFEGYAIDASTGEPIEGIVVSGTDNTDTTDGTGWYRMENLPVYVTSLSAKDENIGNEIGNYFDCLYPVTITSQPMVVNFYIVPAFDLVNTIEPDQYDGRFYSFMRDITDTQEFGRPPIHKSWNHYPLTVLNPPMVHDDVDLQAVARAALEEWEVATGLNLFEEIDDFPSADFYIAYYDSNDRHEVATIAYNEDGTPAKKEISIFLQNNEVPLYRYAHLVYLHELGHILCLDHSRNIGHLMVGLTLPKARYVTTDEANIVKLIYHFPPVHDYSQIIEE